MRIFASQPAADVYSTRYARSPRSTRRRAPAARRRRRNRAIYSGRAPSRRRGGAGSARRPALAPGRVGLVHHAGGQPHGACTQPLGRQQNCAAALHEPIPHCDGPICRRGSPRRLRGGARAPRSVAPVSGAAPLRSSQFTEPVLSPCCTAAGGRRGSDSPIHRWRATTSSATWTNWRVCSAVDAGPAPPPAGRGRSGRSTALTRLRALVAGGGASAGSRRARKKMRGGVGGAPDERTSKTGRSEMHGVKSTSCPQVMNCCATASPRPRSYPLR